MYVVYTGAGLATARLRDLAEVVRVLVSWMYIDILA